MFCISWAILLSCAASCFLCSLLLAFICFCRFAYCCFCAARSLWLDESCALCLPSCWVCAFD
ncbi:hypothetical protein BDV19DRAFT_370387 [Aspergillus venezuelensis]